MAVYNETVCDCVQSAQQVVADWRYALDDYISSTQAVSAFIVDAVDDLCQIAEAVVDTPITIAVDQVFSSQPLTVWAVVPTTIDEYVGASEFAGGSYLEYVLDQVSVSESLVESVTSSILEAADDAVKVSEVLQTVTVATLTDTIAASEVAASGQSDVVLDSTQVSEALFSGWLDAITNATSVSELTTPDYLSGLVDLVLVAELVSNGSIRPIESLLDTIKVGELVAPSLVAQDDLSDSILTYESLTTSAPYGWLFSVVRNGDQYSFPASLHTLPPVAWAFDEQVGLSDGHATVDAGDPLPNRFGVAVVDSPNGNLFNIETLWARGGVARRSRATDGSTLQRPLIRDGHARFTFGKRLQRHHVKLTLTDFDWLRQVTVRVAWSKRRY